MKNFFSGKKAGVVNERLSELRSSANSLLSSPLVKEAEKVKRLDELIDAFLDVIKQEISVNDFSSLKSDVKLFERMVHEELGLMFSRTKSDLESFGRVLNSLNRFREELSRLSGDELSVLDSSEVNYANLLLRDAQGKLKSLSLLFKKLK